jgi:hypothetical protein
MRVNFEQTPVGMLGKKYWVILFCCHATEIERKKAVKFNSKRDDWRTKEKNATMYNAIYNMMFRYGVARELPEPVFQDRGGNTVLESDPKRF